MRSICLMPGACNHAHNKHKLYREFKENSHRYLLATDRYHERIFCWIGMHNCHGIMVYVPRLGCMVVVKRISITKSPANIISMGKDNVEYFDAVNKMLTLWRVQERKPKQRSKKKKKKKTIWKPSTKLVNQNLCCSFSLQCPCHLCHRISIGFPIAIFEIHCNLRFGLDSNITSLHSNLLGSNEFIWLCARCSVFLHCVNFDGNFA